MGPGWGCEAAADIAGCRAELAPTAYVNPYSGREASKFLQRVLKQMERLERSGKYVDALEYCDTQILYCTDVYGHDSDQTWVLCERSACIGELWGRLRVLPSGSPPLRTRSQWLRCSKAVTTNPQNCSGGPWRCCGGQLSVDFGAPRS